MLMNLSAAPFIKAALLIMFDEILWMIIILSAAPLITAAE